MKRLRFASILVLSVALGFFGAFQLVKSRRFQVFGKLVYRTEIREKAIALSFDDGPSGYTDTLLQLLHAEGVKASFFVIGEDLQQHMDYGKKIVAEGHQLGNHSMTHQRMVCMPYSEIGAEIEKTDSLIRACHYKGEIFFRPPYCKKGLLLPYYLYRNNRTTITWDMEPELDAFAAEKPLEQALAQVKPGSIILLHCMESSRKESREILLPLLRVLKKKGYAFKTISELLQIEAKEAEKNDS